METSAAYRTSDTCTIGIQNIQFLKLLKFTIAKISMISYFYKRSYIVRITNAVFTYREQLINISMRYPRYVISLKFFNSKCSRGLKMYEDVPYAMRNS